MEPAVFCLIQMFWDLRSRWLLRGPYVQSQVAIISIFQLSCSLRPTC